MTSPGAVADDAAPASVDPLDWGLAERVARRVAGREPLSSSYLAESLRADFLEVTVQAEDLVAEHTELRVPGPARAQVVDRASWVSANVRSMRRLLEPLTARVGQRMAGSPIAPIGRRIAGTETGVLLGYLAQRVLGQYDLLVLDEDGASDAVYYVGGNILALEKRYAFRPRDFRLWIAIHECTHRAQFTAVPWMKPYYLSLVEDTLSSIDPDPRRLVQALARAAEEYRNGRNPLDDGGLVALLATDEQRGALARVQSLMSLLEGHGNSVMNRIGREHVAGQARMARVLHARRQTAGLAALLHKIVGLDSKMRQYEIGESFVATVEREGGPRAIDAAWRGPEWLPTLDELSDPPAWLTRVA
ncbi:MAG TPA: zinc-dependent metalloprotease [Acidimicrobiia bacterium]|nr:zinc-dependent metalloprotease [Acidimicrobiia bacterium]